MVTAAGRIQSVADLARACLATDRRGRDTPEHAESPDTSTIFTLSRRPAPPVPVGGASERVDVDLRELVGRRLHDVTIVMGLDELRPLGRRTACRRHRWRLHRLTDVREDSSDWPRIDDEGNEPDVAAAYPCCSLSTLSPIQPTHPQNPIATSQLRANLHADFVAAGSPWVAEGSAGRGVAARWVAGSVSPAIRKFSLSHFSKTNPLGSGSGCLYPQKALEKRPMICAPTPLTTRKVGK